MFRIRMSLYLLPAAANSNENEKKNNNDFQKHISRLGIVRKSGWSMEVLVCNFELHFYFFRFQNDRISTSDQLVMMNDVSFAKCAMCIAYVWCGDARTHRTCWRPPYNLSVPFLFIQNWKMKNEQQNTADEEDEDDDEEKHAPTTTSSPYIYALL